MSDLLRRSLKIANAKVYWQRHHSPTGRAWHAMVRAERHLLRGFRLGIALDNLYFRWQQWKTDERLYYLALDAEAQRAYITPTDTDPTLTTHEDTPCLTP